MSWLTQAKEFKHAEQPWGSQADAPSVTEEPPCWAKTIGGLAQPMLREQAFADASGGIRECFD